MKFWYCSKDCEASTSSSNQNNDDFMTTGFGVLTSEPSGIDHCRSYKKLISQSIQYQPLNPRQTYPMCSTYRLANDMWTWSIGPMLKSDRLYIMCTSFRIIPVHIITTNLIKTGWSNQETYSVYHIDQSGIYRLYHIDQSGNYMVYQINQSGNYRVYHVDQSANYRVYHIDQSGPYRLYHIDQSVNYRVIN